MPVRSGYPGLTSEEARARLLTYGRNEVEKRWERGVASVLLSQFTSPLIFVLLAAAGVTFFLGDLADTVVIGAAVALNTFLGFFQEYRAERSLTALSRVLTTMAVVIRDGGQKEVDARELVPGDRVLLATGAKVPADGVVVESYGLQINEAILTGESVAVAKSSFRGKHGEVDITKAFCDLAGRTTDGRKSFDRACDKSVYMGTLVVSGRAAMVVVGTGDQTEMGRIAMTLSQTRESDTPLTRRLKRLSWWLALFVGLLSGIIFVSGVLTGRDLAQMFTVSVAVAVAAIPEGLVISLTAILALGMRRILKRKALVRTLSAAETLGSVTVICTDKTGTLTAGVMRVTHAETTDMEKLVFAAALVNEQRDPLEKAMWEWADRQLKKGVLGNGEKISIGDFIRLHQLVDHIPFEPQRKYAARLFTTGQFVVGAPELLLSYSLLTPADKKVWHAKILKYAQQGFRVVGFGYRDFAGREALLHEHVQRGLTWLGFLVYEDPVRPGVARALAQAMAAGIAVTVITGDFAETAQAVMHALGLPLSPQQIMTGGELGRLSRMELTRRVATVRLFARILPHQKLKVVEALQARGEVVAMMGDGVNDAPALKKADIGIVVATASDVSRETADIVLLNSSFSTIIRALQEGRGIFANLRKVLLYLLSNSTSEVLAVAAALLFGWPLPVTAAQVLWVNLVDDGLPNLALTLDPHGSGLLRQAPRPRQELVDRPMRWLIGLVSVTTLLVVMGTFYFYWVRSGLAYARTAAFTVLAMSSLFYVFSARSLEKPIWQIKWFGNPWLLGAVVVGVFIQLAAVYWPLLTTLLATVPLRLIDFVTIVALSGLVLVTVEVSKWFSLRRHLFAITLQKE